MTHTNMAKIPSYLKGLVETRARADAYVLRLTKLQTEVQAELDKATRDREAADVLIRAYNANLQPDSIVPIHSWKGRYGERGARAKALREFLRAAYPESRTTVEIAWHLMAKFQVDIVSTEERENWKKNAVRNPLRKMRAAGEVEQLDEDRPDDGSTPSSWRWVPAKGAEISKELGALADSASPPDR